MPPSSSWLIPLALFVLLGLAATLYILKSRQPYEARAAGLRMLASLSWSDFVQLVLAVLNGRGYERSFGGAGTEGEYLLERGGQKWLLSSRHSRAWKAGSTAIAEFAAHLRQQGLQGGVLAIPGRFPPAAFTVARAHRIELLDGHTMWDELQDSLSEEQLRDIDRAARRRLRGQYALAWGGALVIAVLVGFAMRDMKIGGSAGVGEPEQAQVEQVQVEQTPLVGGAEAPTDEPTDPVAAPAAPTSEIPPPEPPSAPEAPTADLPIEQRRTRIAEAIAALPHVTGAHWATPSTLRVDTSSKTFDPRSICPLLEQDPELGAARLQVQYPAGSERPVRFLQCRAY